MKPLTRANLIIALAHLFLGYLLAVAFTTQERIQPRFPLSRKKELIKVINDLEKERQELKLELGKTRAQTTSLERKAAASQGYLQAFTEEIGQLELLAGLKKVKGEGLIIELADSPVVPTDQSSANFLVHDYDLRIVVNALWSGGAEAIAINDQRLISSSAIRCVGATVMVNSVRLGSPYIIKAIGPSDHLHKTLTSNPDVAKLLIGAAQNFGLAISITEDDEIVIPAYSGSFGISYTRSEEN